MSTSFQAAQRAYTVVPSDVTALPQGGCESLWIGVGGTLTFIPDDPTLAGGGLAVATTVGVGLFPCKVKRVNATGTSAAQIVALY